MRLPIRSFGLSSCSPIRTRLGGLAFALAVDLPFAAAQPIAEKNSTTASLTLAGGEVFDEGNKLIFDAGNSEASLSLTAGNVSQAVIDMQVRLESDLVITNDLAGHTLTFGSVFQGGTDGAMHDVSVMGAGAVTFGQNIANVDAFTFSGTGRLTFGGTTTLGSLTLSGGILALSTSHLTVDILTVTSDTILDFGTHGESFLAAGQFSIAEGATLTIRNWTDAVDYFHAISSPATSTLTAVTFEGYDAGSAWTRYDNQLRPLHPVPEPATCGAVFVSVALGAFRLRRRRQK